MEKVTTLRPYNDVAVALRDWADKIEAGEEWVKRASIVFTTPNDSKIAVTLGKGCTLDNALADFSYGTYFIASGVRGV